MKNRKAKSRAKATIAAAQQNSAMLKKELSKFTLAAKSIIYEASRMKVLLQMMNTPQGAVTAVHTVMTALEQVKKIPPPIAVILAVHIYVILVDMAQQITGKKASPTKMHQVMDMLAKSLSQQSVQGSVQQPVAQGMQVKTAPVQAVPMPQQAAPSGIIGRAMQRSAA